MTGVKLILTAILFRVLFLRLPHHLYTLVIVPLCHNRRSIFTLGCHKWNDLEPVLDVIQYFPCKMDFLFCPAKGGWIYNIYTPRQGASRLDCICLAALSTIISNIMQRLLVLLYQHYSDIKCPFKYTVQVHSYKNKLRTVNISS